MNFKITMKSNCIQLVFIFLAIVSPSLAAERPNIVFIIADDVSKDPCCITDLSGNPEYAPQMAALKQELFEQLTLQGDLRMTGEGDWYDSAENPYGKEDERDFYQRLHAGEQFRNRSKDYERPDLEDGL
jgi:hypothetical protein